MQTKLLDINVKDKEYHFRFLVQNRGQYLLALPKSVLTDDRCELVAATITGSFVSFRIVIRNKKELEITQVNPSVYSGERIWKLRHEAAPHRNDFDD